MTFEECLNERLKILAPPDKILTEELYEQVRKTCVETMKEYEIQLQLSIDFDPEENRFKIQFYV